MAIGIMKALTIMISSAVVSVFLTPLVLNLGRKFEIVDYPGELSIHLKPKVRAGGISIFIGILVGISMAIIFGWFDNNSQIHMVGILLLGVSMIGLVGLLGDLRFIPSQIELTFQFIPALVVVLWGLRVRIPQMAFISLVISVFYLVGGASSMNLMDGMDGLASGIAVILSFFISIVGYIQDDVVVWSFSAALMGSSLGFLYHNFHPAKIFMGDVGSLMLGFSLASLGIRITSTPQSFLDFISPIIILGILVIDTSLAILRRLISKEGIVHGDRNHLYDWLHSMEFDITTTVYIMYGFSIVLGVIGLLIIIQGG